MRTASIVIASCIMACAGSPSLVSALTWHVPSFDVRQLSTNGDELVDFIAKEGIAVLSNIDGLKEAREEALQAALACTYFHQDAITYNNQFSNKNKNEDGSLSVAFPNGVKRVTWATSSANDPFKMTCEGDIEFANKANKLRSIVNNAADSFVAFLDKKVLNPSSDQPLLKASNANGAYKSFRSVVDAGEHLDHLHVYLNKMAEGKHVEMNVEETLELHTDNGLFVAFVPSMRLDFSTAGDVQDGFSIERSDGTEVNLDFPHDGNVLVIMFGDGINWMSKESHKPIRIVPHALGFSKYTFARAWYGRMFLPPKDAIVKEENNFELFSSKARDLLSVVTGEVMGIGCSGSRFRQLHAGHADSCAHDEMFCWMACRSIANITCTEGTELKCVNSKNGIEWNDSDSHCPTCLPTCFNISQSNSPTLFPTKNPTLNPTKTPSLAPTGTPTNKPTNATSSPTSGAYMITTSGLMAVFTIINFFIMLSA